MMRTQLPQARLDLDAHPGLLQQRYVAHPADGSELWTKAKSAILDAAISSKRCDIYEAAFLRWKKSLPTLTFANDLHTLGRLIVGLGSENVLETGIRLHHTYGMPVIPGSALKGLAAHYCHDVWGGDYKRGTANYEILFGKTEDRGCIIFHDAWLTPESLNPLKLDVLTPHHPKWNDIKDPAAPTDFDSPTPVPFLSVAGTFHVAVSWHGPDSEEAPKWTDLAMDCLRDALFNRGVGGKTSSGYGRFNEEKWNQEEENRKVEVERKRLQDENEAALAAMSPIERSVKEFLTNHPNKQSPSHMKLLEELKKETGRWTTDADRCDVAKQVKQGMQDAKSWGKKDKDAERTAFITKILGE